MCSPLDTAPHSPGFRRSNTTIVSANRIGSTISAVGFHHLWWRTAETTSQTLATTVNQQIVLALNTLKQAAEDDRALQRVPDHAPGQRQAGHRNREGQVAETATNRPISFHNGGAHSSEWSCIIDFDTPLTGFQSQLLPQTIDVRANRLLSHLVMQSCQHVNTNCSVRR